MRVAKELVIEPAQSWAQLQELKNSEWFIHDLEEQLKEHHRLFLEELMRYERQQHLGVAPYERAAKRADQANGFYRRTLLSRLGPMELAVPRSRSGLFQTQVLRRYQRREAAVDEALRKVFLLGVSTRQAGPALATLLDEAVSAATVSAVSKVLDQTVAAWHRRALADKYRYLIFDGVSVRIRLVGKVQRRVALCAYGMSEEGQRELIDFLLVRSESEENWRSLLEELWRRGLRGTKLKLISSDGHPGLIAALELVWPRVALQRLLGAQAAQRGRQTQTQPAAMSARGQTDLSSQHPPRSDRPIPRLEQPLERAGRASGALLGDGSGRTPSLLRLSTGTLETPTHHQCDRTALCGSTTAHPHHVRLYHARQL